MAKRGRPRGLNLNPEAVLDLLDQRAVTQKELAEAAGITTGHMADAIYHRKGLSADKVRLMAGRLGCRPATIAPELTRQFVCVRDGDEVDELEVVA